MALSIKDPEADRLAREVSRVTGETMTAAIVQALRERLVRLSRANGAPLAQDLLRIADRCARLPRIDARSDEEIVGYDEHGLPR